jgi:hypothetical protein
MPTPKPSLTLVNGPAAETNEAGLYLSDPERIEDGEGDWGFAAYAGDEDHRVTFVFKSKNDATRARQAMALALRDATFIATAVR